MQLPKLFFLTAVVASVAGCATTETGPEAKTESVTTTSVSGRWNKEGLLKWEGHRLDSIDGKGVSFGFATNPYEVIVKVAPGEHKFVVLALFNNDRTQLSATIPMTVVLKPSTGYAINAAVSGAYIEAWLEVVSTGEKVTEIFKGECMKSVAEGMTFRKSPCASK